MSRIKKAPIPAADDGLAELIGAPWDGETLTAGNVAAILGNGHPRTYVRAFGILSGNPITEAQEIPFGEMCRVLCLPAKVIHDCRHGRDCLISLHRAATIIAQHPMPERAATIILNQGRLPPAAISFRDGTAVWSLNEVQAKLAATGGRQTPQQHTQPQRSGEMIPDGSHKIGATFSDKPTRVV